MNEDYLWDKTGEDAEIQSLENALQAFRYGETATPALPTKTVSLMKRPAQKTFRLALATAACLALAVISLAAWLQISKPKIEADVAQTSSPQKLEDPSDVAIMDQRGVPASKKADFIKRSVRAIKPQLSSRAAARPSLTTAKTVKRAKSEVRLTQKEQYAYDQLMLALSITGSKLKIVKDKVEGTEE